MPYSLIMTLTSLRTTWFIPSAANPDRPVQGAYVSSGHEGAWNAIESAFYLAVGTLWGPVHTEALKSLEATFHREAVGKTRSGRDWTYASGGVQVTISPA